MTESQDDEPTGSILSPQELAILEAGKNILLESIAVSRDFCKEMITTSSGAIAIYLGLIKFIRPELFEKLDLSIGRSIIISIPAFFLLLASAIFAIGFYPEGISFSLDDFESVKKERENVLNRRTKFARIGFILFLGGLASAIIIIAFSPII